MPGAGVGVADLSRLLIFSEMPFFSSSDCVVSHESSALAHSGSRVLTTPGRHSARHAHHRAHRAHHAAMPTMLTCAVLRPAAWSHLGRTHLGDQIMMLAEDGRHARWRAPEAVHVLGGRGRRRRLGRRHLGEHQAQACEQVHAWSTRTTTTTGVREAPPKDAEHASLCTRVLFQRTTRGKYRFFKYL